MKHKNLDMSHKEQNNEIFNNFHKYHIKFRKSKTRKRMKVITKVVAFIAIAAFSGAMSSMYVINKTNLSHKYYSSNGYNDISNLYSDIIGNVVKNLGQTVVGVYTQYENGKYCDNGSGIIISSDGYIVTSAKLVNKKCNTFVKLNTSKTYKAKIIGKNEAFNLAVIKIDKNNLPFAKLGDSKNVKVGDFIVAVGNPLGEKNCGAITTGIISSISTRKIKCSDKSGRYTAYKLLETDATMNYGNIGGALCNSSGEIIGINDYMSSKDGKANNVVCAVSSNEANYIINSLISKNQVLKTVLGIYGGTAVPVDTSGITGIYVQHISKGSSADKANIRPTDIIVEADNVNMHKIDDLNDILACHNAGDTIKCKIWRNGKFLFVNIVISEFDKKD
ncbi:putative serine protease HhoB precursor [Clostridium tepidiprofundi DSM 19306]|uniref:Putative serine protease HhoB n=1 Tax=Clostridium tepidiprofundi DSM 19306 TaxID=1121338 RepID=A0A151B373_9CLOT|nr:S1C family serine protease [Clostridium tepidiprofundi]KYH34361.1 putative serine protease HhoB precursor [Clostridium tepidiprofundi DSM 19306]